MATMRTSSITTHINSQIATWQKQREKVDHAPRKAVPVRPSGPFVTVSREYGCGGFDVAEKTAEIINKERRPSPLWVAYDRAILDAMMQDLGLSSSLLETLTSPARKQIDNFLQTALSELPPQVVVYRSLAETVRTLATNGNVIIVGRAGRAITRGMERGYHVRIVAPLEWRVERIAGLSGLTRKEAEKMILEKGRSREDFLRRFVKFKSGDPSDYHLVVNNAEHGMDGAARMIVAGLSTMGCLD
ncbi:MAG TPA: cytidylate kinase-like family protein [Spirochaetota bacterium]|nr:cytidylate kinase-like family protein [Spirochaetota bacterium]